MKYLRQNTAATIIVGPFQDKTTALSITTLTDQSANGRLVKNGTGGAITVTSWAHDAGGHYLVGLSTAHVDTIGRLRLSFYDPATYLPVWEDFSVLSPAMYDYQFGTATLFAAKLPAGIVAAGSTTASFTALGAGSNLAPVSGDYTGRWVLIGGEIKQVLGHTYNSGTDTHTFTFGTGAGQFGPLSTAPAAGTTFLIG